MTFNFLKKASSDELADKIRSTSWGSCGSAESALVSLSLHTPGTGSKLIGLPEVTLLTRVAWSPLRLRAHAQYAKCILPLTFGTGLLWARYTGILTGLPSRPTWGTHGILGYDTLTSWGASEMCGRVQQHNIIDIYVSCCTKHL